MDYGARKHTLLVVDDVAENIDILQAILSPTYIVKAAVSGEKALQIAAAEPPPDLILLDIVMPGIDGYEVCRQIKANSLTCDIPVIFVSSLDEAEDETKGLDLGAVDYIIKPVNPSIVRARVRNHLLIKTQRDKLKESISLMEHEAEVLQQKAEMGIQAAGLAHDMNNILNQMQFINFIPDYLPDDLPSKDAILEDVQQVKKGLDLGRVICRGVTRYFKDVGAEAIKQPISELLQPLDMYARSFKGELVLEIEDERAMVCGKGAQLKRIIINIFANAVQAMENRKDSKIVLRSWSEGGYVLFSIKDNGSGISPEVFGRLFEERFTTKKDGTGLGLFLVKQIVDAHKGTIDIQSVMGKGTIVTFSLPKAGMSG